MLSPLLLTAALLLVAWLLVADQELPCPDCGRCTECGTTWCGGAGCPVCPADDGRSR